MDTMIVLEGFDNRVSEHGYSDNYFTNNVGSRCSLSVEDVKREPENVADECSTCKHYRLLQTSTISVYRSVGAPSEFWHSHSQKIFARQGCLQS